MSYELDDPWRNDISIRDVDTFYRGLLEGTISTSSRGIPEPYPLAGDSTSEFPFNHAFAGIIPYAVEPGLLLLQQRDGATHWNPNRISIFGGKVIPPEMPSITAVREFGEETGIFVTSDRLQPLRAYIERRTRVPVFRVIYVLMLDRLPAELRPGEGAGIVQVRATKVAELDQLTMLSREDIEIFFSHWYPRRPTGT